MEVSGNIENKINSFISVKTKKNCRINVWYEDQQWWSELQRMRSPSILKKRCSCQCQKKYHTERGTEMYNSYYYRVWNQCAQTVIEQVMKSSA